MPKILADEQIFSAVMQVVSSRGYSGSTTKQLADAANISEVTLFRKYGSKAQLVKQAISFILDQRISAQQPDTLEILKRIYLASYRLTRS